MDPVHPPVAEPPAPEVQETQQALQPDQQHFQQDIQPDKIPEQSQEHQQDVQQEVQHHQQDLPQSSEAETPTTIIPTAAAEESTLPPTSYHNGYSSDSRAHYEYHTTPTHESQTQPPATSRPSSGLSVTQKQPSQPTQQSKNSVVIKVGMVGDAQIGKTSLMVKYVEGSWDEDYIQTLGVNFMEKTISIRNTEITFSIWDLGGQREFVNMLPLVCNDAVAILFMFDLTRKSTLNSIKEWYRQGRGFNKTAIPFLVGTKYDHFVNFPREDQEEISIQAKRFAKAMKASLIFSSTSHSINVQKIFKIVLAKAFDLKCTILEIENIGEPLLLYKNV
ncbi:P-loop containing nucleoside triphosphate hydrolase protein [Aspergillus granulosus]|uniref:P-loop containing nucleoside triphosphate hydrolase protein n=1 Tax=Aspergillus granulosus TaxID=176169 RepID=A0ABR4HW62_9EURO